MVGRKYFIGQLAMVDAKPLRVLCSDYSLTFSNTSDDE